MFVIKREYWACQIEECHPVYSVLSICYPGSPLWWNPRFSSTLPCSSHTVHWFPCCYSLKAPGIWPPPELCLHLLSVSSAGMLFYQVATWCVPSLLQLFTEVYFSVRLSLTTLFKIVSTPNTNVSSLLYFSYRTYNSLDRLFILLIYLFFVICWSALFSLPATTLKCKLDEDSCKM